LQDWIRGKIPYFVRPPDSASIKPAVPATTEDPTVKVKRVSAPEQDLHRVLHSTSFIAEDEQAANVEPELVDSEWTGIESGGEEQAAVEEEDGPAWEDLFPETAEAPVEATAEEQQVEASPELEEDDVDIDDVDIDVEPESSKPAKRSKLLSLFGGCIAHCRPARFADDDDANSERPRKEKRMTTNKRKSANFYTESKCVTASLSKARANCWLSVKNKNRNKKSGRKTR
jgi:nuclear GTP-binding protein